MRAFEAARATKRVRATSPAKLVPVLYYDGTPITARFIAGAIGKHVGAQGVTALHAGRVA